ncbi:hypothetical protein Tco_0426078 [Tanacetum coccineum]
MFSLGVKVLSWIILEWVRQQQEVVVPQSETPRPPAAYTRDIPALGQNLVMAAPIIFISSDSSEESVVPIAPADLLVALEVGAVFVISPTGVFDLVDYSSSSDSDSSEDSLPLAPELPLVSPFLCSDDSEADSESKPAEQRLESHESLTDHDPIVSRWRDRVTSMPSSPPRSSPHDTLTSSSEFPLVPVVAPPEIRRRQAILV